MAVARVERRLAAILAADIVGYSRLVEQDEARTLAAIKALRRDAIDPLLAEHHGRIAKLMGDGAIVEFGSVVDAVTCAVAVQTAVAERQADVPADRRIVFRIGVNLGDVVIEGDDLLGDGVNVAARLEQICEPGGVLVSGTAYDHLQGKFDLPLEFTGEQQVKNIARPVRVYRVVPAGSRPRMRRRLPVPHHWARRAAAIVVVAAAIVGAATWWLWPGEQGLQARPSIAVLPFDNLAGDEGTGRLADGITEDIITDLSRFREFDVIARNSTAQYKGKAVDVRQVGKDLNVRYVLEGSIQRERDRVRITAQFLEAAAGAHLWSERWDRDAADLFAVQTEVAEQVAARLGGWGVVGAAELSVARRARPRDLGAYELYLQAQDVFQGNTKETTEAAIQLLRRAVDEDPAFARAWVALAYALDYTTSFGADLATAEEAALAAAERAVALDPSDAEAHAALGEIVGTLGDRSRSAAEFATALKLNPGSAHILLTYAAFAATWGEAAHGAELADRVRRLNPNYPTWAGNRLRGAYFSAGRYEDALRMVERQPVQSRTRYGWIERAASYAALGRLEEARAAAGDALARYPGLSIEGVISEPSITEANQQRYGELLRKAGFPLCAQQPDLARVEKPVRLPECLTQ